MQDTSRSLFRCSARPLGVLAALCLLGPCFGLVQGQEALLDHPPRPNLQSEIGIVVVAGVAVYVERTQGTSVFDLFQEHGVALSASELGPTSDTAHSIEFSSTDVGAAEYDIWTSTPSIRTGGLRVNLVAQLGSGAVAVDWKVDLFEFVGKDDWTNIGDLTGATLGGWQALSIVSGVSANNFVDTSSNKLLLRIYTAGASSKQTIYLDQVQILGDDGSTPSPVPSPTAAPVTSPVTPPVAAPATAPAAAPVTDGGTEVVGSVVYVERVGTKGVDILPAQNDGTPLVSAENAATSATTDSVEFTSTAQGVAEFDAYFTQPGVLTGGLTVSVVAQLGAGATAANWKVDLFEFIEKEGWTNVGDLTGVTTSTWSTVSPAVASGASNFIDSSSNEMLARVYTSGASTQETIYVDQIQIFGGGGDQPSTPVPSPVAAPVAPPTAAPVTPPVTPPVAAPTAAPVTAPVSPPVTPGVQQRWSAFSQFVPDWDAWNLNLGNGVCEPLEECRTDPACCGNVTPATCGNGMCEETETRDNCNQDCTHKLSVCGNGVCENNDTDNYHSNWFEDEYSCPADCASPSSNLDVSSAVTGSCFMSGGVCDAVCGDGICSGTDTCTNCPRDCGECAATTGDGICSYPFEDALVGDCAGAAITNFITLDGEDYATIDNTVALDGDFLDGSCTSLPTSVPAGWRLADWDANIALRLVTVSLAKFDTGCLVFEEGNAVSTENGLQGDSETGCGIIPIVRYNGNQFAIASENCASRLMIQRIQVSGTKTCPTCSNGAKCNTLTGTCACNGMWTGPGCDRAIGDFSVPAPATSWYQPALGTTWEWQIDGAPIPGSNGAGSLYNVELYDIDYSYSSSVIADLQSKGKKVMCYISAGTSEDFREDINLFPAIAKGGIVSFGEGDTFADEQWLDLRRLDVIAPIMLERLDIMAARGCDAVEWDNADLPVHETGLSNSGRISVSVQIAYNAWIAAQTHARGMGVAMKNNNEAAAFHVDDYDMVVNEECWINGNCANYWPWIKAGKPILNTEYFTARCMYCTQANLMNLSTIKKVPDLTSCRVDCKSTFSSTQCDAASVSGTVSYPIDWTIGTGAKMSTDWCPMTTNVAADECSATRFATCDPDVGY